MEEMEETLTRARIQLLEAKRLGARQQSPEGVLIAGQGETLEVVPVAMPEELLGRRVVLGRLLEQSLAELLG